MTAQPTNPTQPQPDPGPEQPSPREEPGPRREEPPPRRLTRSSADRVIGGVAGGLGRYLGIDPILVRVVFVVLTFAGGAGIVAYLALLAFVPSDDGAPRSGSDRAVSVAATVALGIAAVVVIGSDGVFFGPGLLFLALLAVAAILVARAVGGGGDPARTAARALLLMLAILAAAAAAVGVAIVAALGGGVVIAVLTIVTGLALVGAALVGGARWLIVPALVLGLPLALVAAADIDAEGGVGKREYRPHDISEMRAAYQLGMGDVLIDLGDVDLPAGRTDVAIDVGLGEATVRVPEDVCVTSDVEIGAGMANVFDRINDGVDVAFAQGGTPDAGQAHLHVKASIGAGRLAIHRNPWTDRAWFHDGRLGAAEAACP